MPGIGDGQLSSAHRRFVRDEVAAAERGDNSIVVGPRPAMTGVAGSPARSRDRHAERAPRTP